MTILKTRVVYKTIKDFVRVHVDRSKHTMILHGDDQTRLGQVATRFEEDYVHFRKECQRDQQIQQLQGFNGHLLKEAESAQHRNALSNKELQEQLHTTTIPAVFEELLTTSLSWRLFRQTQGAYDLYAELTTLYDIWTRPQIPKEVVDAFLFNSQMGRAVLPTSSRRRELDHILMRHLVQAPHWSPHVDAILIKNFRRRMYNRDFGQRIVGTRKRNAMRAYLCVHGRRDPLNPVWWQRVEPNVWRLIYAMV